MDWIQIITSSLSGIIGAAVGGFATYLTMAKQFKFMAEQEIQKQKRDDELYLKRKREDLYAKMYDFLMRFEKIFVLEKIIGCQNKPKIYLTQFKLNVSGEIRKQWICFMISSEIYLKVLHNIGKIFIRLTIRIIRKY